MKNVMCCGLAVLALSVSAGAQDHKMDRMKAEMTYTGCLERSPEGVITLAQATAATDAAKKAMAKDAMSHDAMSHDTMSKDAMSKDSMGHDAMAKESMVPLTLSSTSVDLAKHLGHKVTIKGVEGDTMGSMTTFNVKSMKMVASSCK
jgi:pentapeptide MXKDX repeat protein